MATRLIRFGLRGGGSVLVEVQVDDDRGDLVGGSTIESAKQTFEEALDSLLPVTDAVFTKLEKMLKRPEEVTVELGISLKAEAGVVIAKTAAEGNLKLSLKWKPAGAHGQSPDAHSQGSCRPEQQTDDNG